MISGAVSADLGQCFCFLLLDCMYPVVWASRIYLCDSCALVAGKCREVRGSAQALSTVTGIVDGTGSVGAALGQLIIPSIHMWFGWTAVFYTFILMVSSFPFC